MNKLKNLNGNISYGPNKIGGLESDFGGRGPILTMDQERPLQ